MPKNYSQEYGDIPQSHISPPGRRPSASYKQYNPEQEREEFRQTVLDEFGGDPMDRDSNSVYENYDTHLETQHFNDFFSGHLTWGDRDNMTPHQQTQWQKHRNKGRAYLFDQEEKRKSDDLKRYKSLMGEFDRNQQNKIKRYDAALKRFRTEQRQRFKDVRHAVERAEDKSIAQGKYKTSQSRLDRGEDLAAEKIYYKRARESKKDTQLEERATAATYDDITSLSQEVEAQTKPYVDKAGDIIEQTEPPDKYLVENLNRKLRDVGEDEIEVYVVDEGSEEVAASGRKYNVTDRLLGRYEEGTPARPKVWGIRKKGSGMQNQEKVDPSTGDKKTATKKSEGSTQKTAKDFFR